MELDYRKLFHQAPCYLTVQDRGLRLLDANQRFREDFGPFEGRRCFEVYKRRTEPCEVCPVAETFRSGQSCSSEEQVQTEDGRSIAVIVHTTPIRDERGQITAVVETSTDITALKQLQERYRLLFEEVPCHICIQDREHRVLEANRLAREVFGDPRGQLCYELFKHREDECVECPVRETFADGQIHRSEELLSGLDEAALNALVFSAPIRDAAGEIQSVMEMATDITPLRALQSQLESVGLLISSVSHGLKGLLTGLDGGRYLVTSGLEKSNQARIRQGWEMVERNVDRIRSTVQNILYYAKERELQREVVAPEQLAEEACNLVQPRADEHGIELQRAFERGRSLFADPRALCSMLVNLLENSVDACRVDKKKDAHRVRLALEGRGRGVAFVVEDNGIGMDRETQARAFSLFFSSKGAEGTGLGLFIAEKIAKSHGGSIRLDSAPDRGTRFTVTIPGQEPKGGSAP